MSENSPVLEVKGLSGGYGKVPVLRGIDLSVFPSEIVGILGHNGMGKSTLLKTLTGFLPATSGSVRYHGEDVTKAKPFTRAHKGLGYVPQGRGIFPNLSVRDNLLFAFQGYGETSDTEMLDEVLVHFPRLERLLTREGGALSGGEQQLLALARCLMGEPDCILLDEPTEGIQPSIIEEIVETLLILRKERDLSILLVEQNFEFIADLSDRVLVLERGSIIAELSKSDLTNTAKVDEFLGLGAGRKTRANDAVVSPTQRAASSIQPSKNTGQHPYAAVHAPKHREPTATPLISSTEQVSHMSVKRPSIEQMREMAGNMGFSMSDTELGEYLALMEPNFQSYDRLDATPDNVPVVKYPRTPGYRPSPSENPMNAWYYKTNIQGAMDGPLAGKRVAVKDTICVAGVPLMNGSSIMEGYIPDIDATVITRILDAGGNIAGKAHCEYLCLSGGSHTNATGPVHNPYKHGYMAGGSSSGSAALVAAGEVDMALAGDQGGSIRIPSSNCGVYGMKATHGLVPYSGIMPVEQTIDHVGPVSNSVADNALLLEVIAGSDGLDPRQYKPKVYKYTEALGKGVHGLRIGILDQGFAREESETDVDQKVLAAADAFRRLGAQVENVSVPEHNEAIDYWTAITLEGMQDLMMWGNNSGTNYRGMFMPSMVDHFHNWRGRADELSASLKVSMFVGEYFQTHYRGRFYGKAQNLMRKIKEKYDAVFKNYDLLLMPTVPMKPQAIPPADAPIDLVVQRAFEMIGNTAPFNASGYPAMNVPCGMSEGLPIGMMLVGDNYNEMTIYRAAHAFEQLGDWRNM